MTVSPPANGAAPSGVAASRGAAGRRIRGLEPEERRAERRRQLLDSGLELFARQGYAHTTIEQICQNAYVGFKGFYDEFATKEALFLALYDQLLGRLGKSVVQAVRAHGGAGPRSLRPVLAVFVREVLDDPRIAQVMFIEAAGLSPAVEAARRFAYRRFAAFLEETYVAGGFSPDGRPPEQVNARRVSLGVVGSIVEVMVDWLVDPEPDDLDHLIDDLEAFCRIVLAGLADVG